MNMAQRKDSIDKPEQCMKKQKRSAQVTALAISHKLITWIPAQCTYVNGNVASEILSAFDE